MHEPVECYISTIVEVVAVLYYFFIALAANSTNLMYQVKICLKELDTTLSQNDTSFFDMIGKDVDNCYQLHIETYKEALDIVSKMQLQVQATGQAVQIITNIIACLIIINAGNILGRKRMLLIALVGYFIYHINFILNWYYRDASIWWMLTGACFANLFGARPVLVVTFIMYIKDVTSEKWRTTRLNCIGVIELLTGSFAVISSGWVLYSPNMKDKGPDGNDYYGFYAVFVCALVINLIAVIWTIFVLKETNTSNEVLSLGKIFATNNITESFKYIFMQREDRSRWIVLCLICLFYLINIVLEILFLGPSLLLYFQGLGWSYAQFTTLVGINGIVLIIGCATLAPFLMLKLCWADMTIGMAASAMLAAQISAYIFCPYGNYYVPYIGMFFTLLCGTMLAVVKSTLTKIIPPMEITKVMAVVGIAQALSAIGAPIASLIFSASVDGCKNLQIFQNADGAKNWCSTTFLWIALLSGLISSVLYFLVGRGIKRRQHNTT